jgi:polysaccharide pyruvyl transferase WcaK-like protein
MSHPRTVCFFGLFGQHNLGNDATLHAIVCSTRRLLPEIRLKCVCTGPEEISKRYDISAVLTQGPYRENLRLRGQSRGWRGAIRFVATLAARVALEIAHWGSAYRYLRGVDTLVVPGTGILSDYSTGPLGWPYAIFKWVTLAKLRGCRVAFVSLGAAPISYRLTQWFLRWSLFLADYRSYRDNYSKEFLQKEGFGVHDDPVYPDLVFSLPTEILPKAPVRNARKPVVGLGIKDHFGLLGRSDSASNGTNARFSTNVGMFLLWLLQHGYTVRLLVGDDVYDEAPKERLLRLVTDRSVTLADGQLISEPIASLEDLLPQIGATDIVISPRYHNVLIGLMMGKPGLSLSYNEKFRALMASVGLGEYCQDIDALNVDLLIAQFLELEKIAESLGPQLRQKAEDFRHELDDQYGRVFGVRAE